MTTMTMTPVTRSGRVITTMITHVSEDPVIDIESAKGREMGESKICTVNIAIITV